MAFLGIMPLPWLNGCGNMTLVQSRNLSMNVWMRMVILALSVRHQISPEGWNCDVKSLSFAVSVCVCLSLKSRCKGLVMQLM